MVRFTFFLLCVSEALTKDRHLGEGLAHLQCVVEALAVGHQHHQRDVVGHVDAAQHLDAVGQLRDDVGPHEACHLDALQAGAGELVDQSDLVGGGDGFRLVLKSVARSDFADLDVGLLAEVAVHRRAPFAARAGRGTRGAAIAAMRLRPFADAAAAQVCDAVFGDDGVDVGRARW